NSGAGGAPAEEPDDGDTPRGFPRDATRDFYWVRVFYGTNRGDTGLDDPIRRYQRAYTSTISYGVADVSIPGRHTPGKLENPSFTRLEFRPDPERHVVLMKAIPLDHDTYMADLRKRVAEGDSRECFIFVHGFN